MQEMLFDTAIKYLTTVRLSGNHIPGNIRLQCGDSLPRNRSRTSELHSRIHAGERKQIFRQNKEEEEEDEKRLRNLASCSQYSS